MWSENRGVLWYCSHLMTGMKRHFLGWENPFLQTSAKWLQENYLHGELGSANDLVIVVSGKEVGRRLQSLLVTEANERNRAIDLPNIVTTSGLLHQLSKSKEIVATESTLTLATSTILRSLSTEKLSTLVGPDEYAERHLNYWCSLADEVNAIASEILSSGFQIDPMDWPESAQQLLTQTSRNKFELIHQIRVTTNQSLAEVGIVTVDEAWHQLCEEELHAPKAVVLLGISDLKGVVRNTIANLQKQGVQVTTAIRCSDCYADYFDEYGCVIPEKWSKENINIEEDSIQVAGSPSHQATALISGLSSLDCKYSREEITVAVTSKDSIPTIRRQLDGYGIATRYAGGKLVSETSEFKLISAIGEFLQSKTFDSFAALVRHPFLAEKLSLSSEEVRELDNFYKNHMPSFVGDTWFTPQGISKYVRMKPVLKTHEKVFAYLKGQLSLKKNSSITTCAESFRLLLIDLYGNDSLERRSPRLAVLTYLFGIVDEVDALPQEIMENVGGITLSQLIRFVLDRVANCQIPEYPNEHALEVVGWLEAMYEDSPCLFVLGMDSTLVDASSLGSASIPESLRELLELNTTSTKLARDTHAVKAMIMERRKHGKLSWIVGRKNASGDLLTPNPLLLRSEDDKLLAKRARKLVVDIGTEYPNIPPLLADAETSSTIPTLQLPSPDVIQCVPIERLSVTAFKDYLACSYRFWLRRMLNLDDEDDNQKELDFAFFGTLVHGALERLGNDEVVRDLDDEQKIKEFLIESVDIEITRLFGKYPYETIKVQAAMAKQRLATFASIQAQRIRDGWRIVEVERKVEWKRGTKECPLVVVGKIDRIDEHTSGAIQILDYKTGSTTAKEAHGTVDEWRDLQLPIYRHLAKSIGYDLDSLETGFILIGSREDSIKFDFPKWDELQIAVADGEIDRVIKEVQAMNFSATPVSPAPPFCKDLSWICQDGGVIRSEGGEE